MFELLLLALALAMDAFAAALSQGAAARPRPTVPAALRVGFAFGGAQAVMPLLGWSLGLAFESIVRDVDHWIAFVLLTLIGGHMLRAGLGPGDDDPPTSPGISGGWVLAGAAVATSIDAAAAGITIPLLGPPIAVACAVIGAVAGLLSVTGVLLGGVCGALIGRKAEVAGGVVLIGLGCKILIEHLYFGAG